jgi:hypothetical protein
VKTILEFNLPEEKPELDYALAGVDALLVISDILSECRCKLKYDSGEFKDCDDATIEKVRDFVVELKHHRNLPELE